MSSDTNLPDRAIVTETCQGIDGDGRGWALHVPWIVTPDVLRIAQALQVRRLVVEFVSIPMMNMEPRRDGAEVLFPNHSVEKKSAAFVSAAVIAAIINREAIPVIFDGRSLWSMVTWDAIIAEAFLNGLRSDADLSGDLSCGHPGLMEREQAHDWNAAFDVAHHEELS